MVQTADRMNANYRIVDSIHVGNTEFVMGQNEIPCGTRYVTWRCYNGTDYFWGHYFDDELAAKRDLIMRALDELEGLEESHKAAD